MYRPAAGAGVCFSSEFAVPFVIATFASLAAITIAEWKWMQQVVRLSVLLLATGPQPVPLQGKRAVRQSVQGKLHVSAHVVQLRTGMSCMANQHATV